jgi:hypothetical protein
MPKLNPVHHMQGGFSPPPKGSKYMMKSARQCHLESAGKPLNVVEKRFLRNKNNQKGGKKGQWAKPESQQHHSVH